MTQALTEVPGKVGDWSRVEERHLQGFWLMVRKEYNTWFV